AIRVHDFVLLREQVIDFLRLFTETRKRTAGTRGVVNRAAIVMSELDQNEIVALHIGQHFVPQPCGYERATAASGASSIQDVYFRRVKILDEWIAPSQ